jgi:hypothetical protein
MNSAHFSFIAPVFNGITFPDSVIISGYASIIYKLQLPVPLPDVIATVSTKNAKFEAKDYITLPHSYAVNDTEELSEIEALYKHLVFSLKYEGVNLLVLSALSRHYSEKELTELLSIEPTGQYSRRLWFLVEWLLNKEIAAIPNLTKKSYVDAIDTKLQYAVEGIKSTRHLVNNNLPGTLNFCPLIRKTKKLETYIQQSLASQNEKYLKGIRKSLLQRASAFLLLKDSKASFTIEGESPKSKRMARWGQAIGQAGVHNLSHTEFERLQQLVIENSRFIDMGYRKNGGFIGDRDKDTFSPIPDHISAKQQDIEQLMNGLITTNEMLVSNNIDAVLAASVIAFGFVFIHPFVDGNGCIHRYLIHHVLAKKLFTQQGIIFPVSSSILDKIIDYQKVLEHYSMPLLDFIECRETKDYNVEVLNDTIDYYRFFDATLQAEFLYECVKETIEKIIPEELEYLNKYEAFKAYIDNTFEMPDDLVALLVRFLEQNKGRFSKRAQTNEFKMLQPYEMQEIEQNFKLIFGEE